MSSLKVMPNFHYLARNKMPEDATMSPICYQLCNIFFFFSRMKNINSNNKHMHTFICSINFAIAFNISNILLQPTILLLWPQQTIIHIHTHSHVAREKKHGKQKHRQRQRQRQGQTNKQTNKKVNKTTTTNH